MSKNIVFEGWLTKSPPAKRIWRTKWRRRWFALRQSGELPGQYFLDYYADRNCRRLKGTINLDLCEQVDAGLHMERTSHDTFNPKLRGSVFTIQTQSRIYHLEADCESDMEKWVDAICRVCGLRATDVSENRIGERENINLSSAKESVEFAGETGPYIPISECITGVKAQVWRQKRGADSICPGDQRAFTFDPKNIVVSGRTPFERVPMNRHHQLYMSQPHIRLNNAEFSENESNPSDEECKSLNASQSNMKDWSVTKSFTKLAISPKKNGFSENGPPVPPRPPKTLPAKDVQKETQQVLAPQSQEPWRMSHGGALPAARCAASHRSTDDEEEYSPGHSLMQYCNLPSLPPVVDRALKPRHCSRSIGAIHCNVGQNSLHRCTADEIKTDDLQYLDLDLHSSKPPASSKNLDAVTNKMSREAGKPQAAVDLDSTYKTVDFLKTEAFNMTRQDAEASRSNQI